MNEKPTKDASVFHEMRPEYDFGHARQGGIIHPAANKARITIRIDSDVLAWFRQQAHEQGGGSYQRMINEALREYMEREMDGDLETRLRKMLREELRTAHIG